MDRKEMLKRLRVPMVVKQSYKKYYMLTIPNGIFKCNKLKFSDKLVFMEIYTMNVSGHPFYKTNKTLAKDIGVSKRTIPTSLNRLKALKLISIYYNDKNNARFIFTSKSACKYFGAPKRSYINKKHHVNHHRKTYRSFNNISYNNGKEYRRHASHLIKKLFKKIV